jgi:hypothetical protein
MKKLLGILFLYIFLSGKANSEETIYIKCTGMFPQEITNQLIYTSKETQIAKIDYRKRKIIFETGYEFKLDKNIDIGDSDFWSIRGQRKSLLKRDTEELWLNRFSGDAYFIYRSSDNKITRPKNLKLNCERVERKF